MTETVQPLGEIVDTGIVMDVKTVGDRKVFEIYFNPDHVTPEEATLMLGKLVAHHLGADPSKVKYDK